MNPKPCKCSCLLLLLGPSCQSYMIAEIPSSPPTRGASQGQLSRLLDNSERPPDCQNLLGPSLLDQYTRIGTNLDVSSTLKVHRAEASSTAYRSNRTPEEQRRVGEGVLDVTVLDGRLRIDEEVVKWDAPEWMLK
ncbi:hypothetical protein Cob_v003901 [Colletotrichum orbiculare MAFF 240422]|uniref:Uncharacterized protein n=1 Tax=Colletotrichum orbiculare (strain 104-T / ATCC 96160 / CBS 514.97 / LARS 414 / MAFF 240422) TaxID=1213857 RepID=A0A484FZ20_COLOR|nr:hypothetical protein Cob_v003901 [Colletotrichum orbiculare MAFF 240422]